MCGLVGVLSSNMTDKKIEIFNQLMVVAALRGAYGAGIAAVPAEIPKNSKYVVPLFRKYVCSGDLVEDQAYLEHIKKVRPGCLIGHARWPTSGTWDEEHCHPIHHRHIIGTHDGTLKSVNRVPLKDKDYDSGMLFQALSEHDNVKVLNNTSGSFAVAYMSKNADRLYFARNKDQPLSFAMVDGDDTSLFWASEAGMLQFILSRNTPMGTKIRHFPLPPNLLISYRLHFDGRVGYDESRPLTVPTENVDRMIFLPTLPGQVMEKKDLIALLHKGCANCHSAATLSDFTSKKVTFYLPDEFFCSDCLEYDPMCKPLVESYLKKPPTSKPTQH